MIRTTFGELPLGAVFFYRVFFWQKRRLYQQFEQDSCVGARRLVGAMASRFSDDTPVWIEV